MVMKTSRRMMAFRQWAMTYGDEDVTQNDGVLTVGLGADVVMKKEGVSTVGDDVVMKTSRRMMAFGQLAMTW